MLSEQPSYKKKDAEFIKTIKLGTDEGCSLVIKVGMDDGRADGMLLDRDDGCGDGFEEGPVDSTCDG